MNKDWETIYETTSIFKAELIQELLNEHEIESIILNQQDSSYLSFGEIKVMVKRDIFILAKNLINESNL
jgi:Putative prokaryotic signal transducing protein